jgi:hypothetical protein
VHRVDHLLPAKGRPQLPADEVIYGLQQSGLWGWPASKSRVRRRSGGLSTFPDKFVALAPAQSAREVFNNSTRMAASVARPLGGVMVGSRLR